MIKVLTNLLKIVIIMRVLILYALEVLMEKNFKRFKSRARLQAILSSVLIGSGGGVLFAALSMLISKLLGNTLHPAFYFVGVGIAALAIVTLYFVFNPSDERLARRLDLLYGLNEKIGTMVEFRDDPGAFYSLQREDAEEKLSEAPINLMKSRTLVSGVVTLALAASLMLTAVLVPVKAAYEEPIDEFDKQWILTSLDEIVANLQSNRFMNADLRDYAIDELNDLIAFVEGSTLFSEMKAEAIKKIINIDSELDKTNTAVTIGEKFKVSSDEKLVNVGKNLSDLSSSGTRKAILEFGESLVASNYDAIGFTASEMNSYLMSSGVAIDYQIYVIFKTLIVEMQNGSMRDIEAAAELAAKNIEDLISIQNLNVTAISRAISGVCTLFGITQSDLDEQGVEVVLPDRDTVDQSPEDDSETKEPDASMGSGGLGSGDVIYGSNDMVYDPYRNTYVPYGVLINEYFAKVNEKITDGKVSDEEAKLFDTYFGLLLGSKNEQNDSN